MEGYTKTYSKSLLTILLILTVFWITYSIIFNTFTYSFGIIFSFIYFLFFIFLDKEKKYYVIIYTLPFASIFKINSSLPSSLVFLVVIYIIHSIVQKSFKVTRIDLFLLVLFSLTQFITISYYQGSYTTFLSFILNILFMKICILNLKNSQEKTKILISSGYVFSISLFFSIIISEILPKIPYIVLREKQTMLMSINRFSGLNGDPNYYSQLVLIAVCLLTAIIISRKVRFPWVSIVLCTFLLLYGLKSISKSYALSIVVVLIMATYYFYRSINLKSMFGRKLKWLFMLIIINIGIISLYFVVQDVVIPIFQTRTDAGDILTGRGLIWNLYMQLFYLKPEIFLFGVGFSNDAAMLDRVFGVYMAPHNIYIELLVGCGILGIIIMLILFAELFANIKSKLQSPFLMFFIVILFTSMGLSLSSNDVFFILTPLLSLITIGGKKAENISNNHT